MRESELERKVCEYAEAKGMVAVKGDARHFAGFPDRIILCGGCFALIEFKTEEGRLSALQKSVHINLLKKEIHVHVVRSVEAGKKLIDRLDKYTREPDCD